MIILHDMVEKIYIPKFNFIGSDKEDFMSYLNTVGIPDSIQSEHSPFVIVTDRKEMIDSKLDERFVAFPYENGFDSSKIHCKKLMTYALDLNGADVVGKNVRCKSDFTAFELLSNGGIGRVYLNGTKKNYPKYALALACGIMLSGIDLKTAVEIVSRK